MTISQWQDAMETNVPARVLCQLQTLSIKGDSEVLSLSKQMSMMNNNSQLRGACQVIASDATDRTRFQPTRNLTDFVFIENVRNNGESCLFKPDYGPRIHMRNSNENDAFCTRFGLLSLDGSTDIRSRQGRRISTHRSDFTIFNHLTLAQILVPGLQLSDTSTSVSLSR
jgi:hypothetical protein